MALERYHDPEAKEHGLSIASGTRLSHYRLVEKIGEGGMGVVWKAVDTRLDREVALKLLPGDFEADLHRLARLDSEARAVAALNHPNIVTIHSIEESEGHRFLVMEFVRGCTLDRFVPEEGLTLGRFLDLALTLTDALGSAHERGVVHRDLKPKNIMIGDDGRLRILDFGMAKSPEPLPGSDATDALTQSIPSGSRLEGTMAYMAPEQVKSETLDARCDLFTLGVLFYEMLSGRRPFAGETAAELIASILRDEPPLLTALRPDLPGRLAGIVCRAMNKDRDHRYQSATDLGGDLERFRRDLERGLVSAGAVDPTAPPPVVTSLAVLPLDNLSGDPEQAYFTDGMTDMLINKLARIGALKVISRTSVMRYKNARKPLPETARELGVDALVEGSVLRVGERVRITVQLIDAARDSLLWAESYEYDLGNVLELQGRAARTIAEQIQVELTAQEHAHLAQAHSVDPAVHEACLRGRHFWYQRTTESVRKGLEYFEEAVELDPTYAPAHAGIADSCIVDGGRYLGITPHEAYTRARAAAERAVELDENLAEAHTSLAAVMTDYDWDWEGADREYRRAIELNPNYVTAHSWYAEQLSRMGRHDEAVAEARRARELDPLSLASSMIVAWILYFARRYGEAIEQAIRTLEIDPNYATALRILGWAYEETGQFDEAVVVHERAAELSGQQPNFMGQIARAYALAGRTDEARGVLDRLIGLSKQTYVSALDIALIHSALGAKDPAFEWLEKAHEERADHLPYSKVNPRLDDLRGDPRFRRMLQQMGLEPDEPGAS
jgi:TolB-like protein/Flp pilus assembly protein TadD